MELLKIRTVSKELSALRSLNTRMELSAKEKQHYLHLEKGYQGEVLFDQLTDKLQTDIFVLNDLNLEYNNNFFQIDSLIISQETIYLFEVKNYEGDYIFESDNFQTVSRNEIQNPLDQLKRSKTLLRQLLKSLGFHLPIEGYVVFINPEFTLYQAPLNAAIILPTQLNRNMKKFNQIHSKLTAGHQTLAEQLISIHQKAFPFTKLPLFNYDQLKKGILSSECHSFMRASGESKVVCDKCGREEDVESAVLRSVEEIKLLFPDIKITLNIVYEWCKIIESKKKIRRILKENFLLNGYGQWTYYELRMLN